MTSHASVCLSCTMAALLTASAADARAQGRRGAGAPTAQNAAPLPSDPLTGPVVTNAPFSGDAVTTVTQTLADGTRIEQKTEAKFYRDSAGRVRREETILGLPALNPSGQSRTVITIDPTPGDQFAYTLDPAARTARRVARSSTPVVWLNRPGLDRELERVANLTLRYRETASTYFVTLGTLGVGTFPLPNATPPTEESLGARAMEGVTVAGRKTTSTIAAGQIGNDRPIVITNERWESPDLRVLIYSRFSDPRTGVVEYKLTNINRGEPSPDLFAIPSDYTVIEPGTGGQRSASPGGRTGGPAGRGPQ